MIARLDSIPSWAIVLLAVLAVVQITLDVIALVDLYRRDPARVTLGNKWAWVAIILLINTIGAILYFALGRTPSPVAEQPGGAPARRASAEGVADALYGPRDPSERE